MSDRQPAGEGATRRRRERRLRQWARHEKLSVQTALSEFKHHSSRGQRKDRAGGEARVVLHGHVPEAPLPQGSRPPCLGEPRGPQDQDQPRTVEQAVCRLRSYGADSGCTCCADGGTAAESHAVLRHGLT